MKKINHWINGKNVAGSEYFQTTNPASGTGREGGEYSFEVFAEMKNVCISMGDHPIPKWGI